MGKEDKMQNGKAAGKEAVFQAALRAGGKATGQACLSAGVGWTAGNEYRQGCVGSRRF